MEAVIQFLTSEYVIHLLILILLYVIMGQSFNLSFGFARSFNLAHIAAYAVGAYSTALLSVEYGWSIFTAMAVGVVLSGVFSLLVGAIAVRLAGEYFAMGTIAFSALVTALLINWKSLTRGVLGVPGILRPDKLDDNSSFLYALLLLAVVVQTFFGMLYFGSFGRLLRAQGEFENGAKALGHHTAQARTISFVIASMVAGLGGGVYATYMSYIDPSVSSFAEMVFVLTVVIVGRPGSFWGMCAGSAIMVLLPEVFRFFEVPPEHLGPYRQLMYGVVLFILVYVRREQLFPMERKI